MNFSKETLAGLIRNIDDPRNEALLKIYNDHQTVFHTAKGSTSKHHVWEGGYADHVAECLRINEIIYDGLNMQLRPLPYKKASAAIALFFHDIEKLFRYGSQDFTICKDWHHRQAESDLSWGDIKYEMLEVLQRQYHFRLTEDEMLAIKYAHGEGDKYHPEKIILPDITTHVHAIDALSSRPYSQDGQGLA